MRHSCTDDHSAMIWHLADSGSNRVEHGRLVWNCCRESCFALFIRRFGVQDGRSITYVLPSQLSIKMCGAYPCSQHHWACNIPRCLRPYLKSELTQLLFSCKFRPKTPRLMWTLSALPVPFIGTPSILFIAASKNKLSGLAELSRLQLREKSVPLTLKTFVEWPSKRELKMSAEQKTCASVSQKSGEDPAQRSNKRRIPKS